MPSRPHRTALRAGGLAALMTCAALAVSCGSDAPTETAVNGQPTPTTPAAPTADMSTTTTTVTTTTTAPATTSAPPTTGGPLMPDVVGQVLQDAQDIIQETGVFYSRSFDCTGAGRRQINDGNWVVVTQQPAPGSPLTEGDALLGVVKLDESRTCG